MENLEFNNILRTCKQTNDLRVVLQGTLEVAKSKNPYFICDFAEEVELADHPEIMPILQKAMVETNDYVHIYEFAFLTNDMKKKHVDNDKLLQQIVLSFNPKLMAYSIEFVPELNKEVLLDALGECGNEKWIEHVLSQENLFDGIEENKKQELLEKLKNRYDLVKGKIVYPECVKVMEDYSPEVVAKAALNSGNAYVINEVAENMIAGNGDVDEFLDKIIETGDILHIYEFGASVPGANIAKVEQAAIDSGMPKYMYYVGAYVPGADTEKMLDAIKKTKNKKYIEKMQEHIKEASQLD